MAVFLRSRNCQLAVYYFIAKLRKKYLFSSLLATLVNTFLIFVSPPTPKSADRANRDNVRVFNDLKYRGRSRSGISSYWWFGSVAGGGGSDYSSATSEVNFVPWVFLLLAVVLLFMPVVMVIWQSRRVQRFEIQRQISFPVFLLFL